MFSESELKSLAENLNNTNIPWNVREQIKKYITDSGATYYIDPKTRNYVVENKGKNGTTPTKVGSYWAPPSIIDWSSVESKLDKDAYELEDPAKYLRFSSPEQTKIDPVFAGRLAKYAEKFMRRRKN